MLLELLPIALIIWFYADWLASCCRLLVVCPPMEPSMLAEFAFKFYFISIFSLRDILLPSLDVGGWSPSPSLVRGGDFSPILSLLVL